MAGNQIGTPAVAQQSPAGKMPTMSDIEPAAIPAGADQLHPFDLLIAVGKRKTMISILVLAAAALGAVIALLMPPVYTSKAKIMLPINQGAAIGNVLGQFGALGSAAGLPSARSPADLYIGILESRTLADALIRRFDLVKRFASRNVDEARRQLAAMTEVELIKRDGMIEIRVNATDPQFAAELANSHVDELIKLGQKLAVGESALRRLFYERELLAQKNRLADAEVEFKNVEQSSGIVQPEGQLRAAIGAAADIRAAVAAKEVQIAAMRTFATERNPEYQRLLAEASALRAQLARSEGTGSPQDSRVIPPAGAIPGAKANYVRALRELKYQEGMFEMLSKQYEAARMDEAKEAPVIQVLDPAIAPEFRTKPKRTILVLLGATAGLVVGILAAIWLEVVARSMSNPVSAGKWAALRGAWRLRRAET